MSKTSRRDFLKAGLGAGAARLFTGAPGLRGAAARPQASVFGLKRAIASDNGIRATAKAMEVLDAGGDPLDAVVAGVNIVEDDPNDTSVGYGGLPNENGVVELDASVMYGPTHTAGGVAALRNIKNPSRVAKLVMERTDHVLLVGDGALAFAKAHGFPEENLLTEKAREIWLRWKENVANEDFWYPPKRDELPEEVRAAMASYGTINCLALDPQGRLAGVTTTSGRAFKLAGRVGDSPIIGAGLYIDNDIGAAGSTGRGEANLQTCASYGVVELMGRGLSPVEACLKQLERIADKSRHVPRLCDANGRPNFGLSFYALNVKGDFAAATMWSGGRYAAHDGRENKLREAAYLFKKEK